MVAIGLGEVELMSNQAELAAGSPAQGPGPARAGNPLRPVPEARARPANDR